MWEAQDSSGTSYHRQYVLDHIATTERTIAPGNVQHFGDKYEWRFHSWPNYKQPRKIRIKGNVEERWPGVPPDKMREGTPGESDLDRIADRLAQVSERGSSILKDSLGLDYFYFRTAGNMVNIDGNNSYHQNPSSLRGDAATVKAFNLATILRDQPQLKERLEIPQELQAGFERVELELDNVLTTAEDVMSRFDEIDVLPDIPVDEWILKMEKFRTNINFLEQNCDH